MLQRCPPIPPAVLAANGGLAMLDTQHPGGFRNFALALTKRDDSRALVFLGCLVLFFGLVHAIAHPTASAPIHVGSAFLGTSAIIMGQLLASPRIPAHVVPWAFCGSTVVVVLWLLLAFRQEAIASNLVFVAIAMTALGPLAFDWTTFLTGSLAILGLDAWSLVSSRTAHAGEWMSGFAAAGAVGAVLLLLKRRLLSELFEAEQSAVTAAGFDQLTGLLNRRGLLDRVDTVWADAARRAEVVSLHFLDVRGLKAANDQHGHDLGDEVLTDVAAAIRATVRGGDLCARWGGDEFIVLSVGDGDSADALSRRLNGRLVEISRAHEAGWIGGVSVGHALAPATEFSFEQLTRLADEDMYRRRGRRRARKPGRAGGI